MLLLSISFLVACNALGIGDGCLERDLDLYCYHYDIEAGLDDFEPDCESPQYLPSYQCGDYDVADNSGGFSGGSDFFDRATGEHVATRYWTDVMGSYCGDNTYWYGRRVECDPTCYYDDFYEFLGVPRC